MDTTKRAACWSVTINNPTEEDEDRIALARQQGWKVDGQLEVGEEGTQHYQLVVRTPQVRFSQVKKAFPRAHIEIARNPSALAKYCDKADTRVAKLATATEMYPSLTKYWQLLSKEIDAINPYIFRVWDEVVEWDSRKAGRAMPTPLEAMKLGTRALIVKGYHVESIASNPLTKSMWKDYHRELMYRAWDHDVAAVGSKAFVEAAEAAETRLDATMVADAVESAVDLPVVNTYHATQTPNPSPSQPSPCTHSQIGGAEVCPSCWERPGTRKP